MAWGYVWRATLDTRERLVERLTLGADPARLDLIGEPRVDMSLRRTTQVGEISRWHVTVPRIDSPEQPLRPLVCCFVELTADRHHELPSVLNRGFLRLTSQ